MGARLWLVAGVGRETVPPEAVGVTAVRDNQMRVWVADGSGMWHTADARHHASWHDLHARFDLMEVA